MDKAGGFSSFQEDEVRLKARTDGAVAQLGERRNGIAKVRGSIPLGSTIRSKARLNQQSYRVRSWEPAIPHGDTHLLFVGVGRSHKRGEMRSLSAAILMSAFDPKWTLDRRQTDRLHLNRSESQAAAGTPVGSRAGASFASPLLTICS